MKKKFNPNPDDKIKKPMRKFSVLTVGTILDELERELPEGWGVRAPKRVTFYRLEKELRFPVPERTEGKVPWRAYTRNQVETIKRKIREKYRLPDPVQTVWQ